MWAASDRMAWHQPRTHRALLLPPPQPLCPPTHGHGCVGEVHRVLDQQRVRVW